MKNKNKFRLLKAYKLDSNLIINKKNYSLFYSLLSGVLIGFINGFWGGGGGMVCVPALTFLCGKETKIAHSTAVFIMLPLSLISAIIYMINKNVDYSLTLYVTIGFVLGGLIGAYLLKKIKSIWIEIIFCLIIFYCGIKMFF